MPRRITPRLRSTEKPANAKMPCEKLEYGDIFAYCVNKPEKVGHLPGTKMPRRHSPRPDYWILLFDGYGDDGLLAALGGDGYLGLALLYGGDDAFFIYLGDLLVGRLPLEPVGVCGGGL